MAIQTRRWRNLLSGRRDEPSELAPAMVPRQTASAPQIDIAPDDPLIAYFQRAPEVVDIDRLELDSPALRAMRDAGVRLLVPLVSQGELIGLLNLGPRLSQQEYSADDRALLNNLATQTAPAVRVAQLVREQQAQAQERERIEQEMRIARLIQQTLLPKHLPEVAGWRVSAHYQPAREVGGDFYDFLDLPDGKLGLVVGDVTDKGVPAALVMATTRSVLRAAAQRIDSPGEVLARVNDLMVPDIPANMFVTCMYSILDTNTGLLRFANAGHDLPYRRHAGGAQELRATGMPLGLMEGMYYEEKEVTLEPGDSVLFYSDGLVEAHDPERDMFSFGRLQQLVAGHSSRDETPLVGYLLGELERFTGPGWEQEDDITLVTLDRTEAPMARPTDTDPAVEEAVEEGLRQLATFEVASEPGNERLAIHGVVDAVRELDLPAKRLDQLKTAVGEATMNAMEHGNDYRPDQPVAVRVLASDDDLAVFITDHGGEQGVGDAASPDIEAKLAGLQSPRGWGLFLIRSMVDEMNVTSDEQHHTVELVMRLGREPAQGA